MTDDLMREFQTMTRAAQILTLALEGFDVARLDFDSWRVANGRDPEWAASERQPSVAE